MFMKKVFVIAEIAQAHDGSLGMAHAYIDLAAEIIEAFELLERIGVKRHKIASGEVKNFLLLDKIVSTKKPILLSSGMSSYNDIDMAVGRIQKVHDNFSVLQCTSQYPTLPETLGLNILQDLQNRYSCAVGLSDHSGRIEPGLAAVTLGAEIYEGHIVFSKRMFGPDVSSSLDENEFRRLIEGIRYLEVALSSSVKKLDTEHSIEMKKIFGKSLALRRNLKAGSQISLNDLETKKPAGRGISPEFYETIIGKKLKKDLNKNDFITERELSDEK